MTSVKTFIILQLMNVLASSTGVLFKTAALISNESDMYDVRSVSFIIIAFIILALYAVLWQRILKRVDLSVAYMQRGVLVFWGLLWSYIVFGEEISVFNIVGAMIAFAGTVLVYKK